MEMTLNLRATRFSQLKPGELFLLHRKEATDPTRQISVHNSKGVV